MTSKLLSKEIYQIEMGHTVVGIHTIKKKKLVGLKIPSQSHSFNND